MYDLLFSETQCSIESPIERTQTKDWANSKETAELIYSEFFSQGDLEKAMGNKPQVGRNVFKQGVWT